MKKIVLSASEVKKSFGRHAVLRGVDLSVRQGEIFGLIGPSGAGKTTLIRILIGELSTDSGSVSVLGASPMQADNAIYRSMGVVFDSLGLFERLTCEQNLSVFAQIHGIEISRIRQALADVGLSDSIRCKACHLSRGMRQRLAIARSMLHNPKILFLDEPTSGLDPVNTAEIHRLIMAQRDRGTTVFLTTHRMDEAMKLCDRILLLKDGVAAEEGSPAEICARYSMDHRIFVTKKDGEELCLSQGKEDAEVLYRLMQEKAIVRMHTVEPDLETVFLEISGRKENTL